MLGSLFKNRHIIRRGLAATLDVLIINLEAAATLGSLVINDVITAIVCIDSINDTLTAPLGIPVINDTIVSRVTIAARIFSHIINGSIAATVSLGYLSISTIPRWIITIASWLGASKSDYYCNQQKNYQEILHIFAFHLSIKITSYFERLRHSYPVHTAREIKPEEIVSLTAQYNEDTLNKLVEKLGMHKTLTADQFREAITPAPEKYQ